MTKDELAEKARKEKEDELAEEVRSAVSAIKTGNEELKLRMKALEDGESSEETKQRILELQIKSDKEEIARKKMLLQIPGNYENADKPKKGEFHYEVKSEYDKAFFGTYLGKGLKFLKPEETKVLRLSDNIAAGYLASSEYSAEIIKGITEFSPIRQEARVKPTSSKSIEIPKRTALPDTHWVGEIEERIEDESLEYALETLTPHELISFKKVSLQQFEDSEFSLAMELGEAFSEGFGKKEGTGFVSGTGVLQPEGFLTHKDVGSTETATASVIGANDIMAFPYKVARGYRAGAKWYMNDVTIAVLRLFRADAIAPADGLGPFLWQNSLIGGEPDTLCGYPVVSCPDMPDIADSAFPIVFGNMKKAYLIVDRIQISVQELRERYAEFGIVGYLARKRVAGQVVLAEALHKLKILAA